MLAVILNAIIGLSGLGVALTFANAALGGVPLPAGMGVEAATAAMAGGFGAYSVLALIGALGTYLRNRVAWALALLVDIAGLAVIVGATVAAGADAILLTGVAVWGVATFCLVAPSTRRAVRP